MLRIRFKWFALACFDLHWNASSFVQMVPICIWMVRITFQRLEYAFECFKYRSKGSNLHSNASNLVRMVRICIRMLRIPFELLKFSFEWFKLLVTRSNLHSNYLNFIPMVWICMWILRIWIQMFRIPFEWLEFAFQCVESRSKEFKFALEYFESLLNGLNLDSNALNAFRMVRIHIQKSRISFQGLEFAFECFKFRSNG